MPVKPIPEGYSTVTPYLVVPNVAKVIEFAEKAFGATQPFPPFTGPDGRIMHAEVQIGNSRIMMGEPMGQYQPMPAMLHLYVEDCDATYKRALEAGATSVQEPSDQFYGDRSGGVKDLSGNMWWVATHIEDVPPEEMEERAKAAMAAKR